MIQIPLVAIPNQSLSFQFEDNFFNLAINEANDIMAVDIVVNDNALQLTGIRAVPGTPLIPYPYLQTYGNFIILTENEEYPYYTAFGITQSLIYISPSELEALENA